MSEIIQTNAKTKSEEVIRSQHCKISRLLIKLVYDAPIVKSHIILVSSVGSFMANLPTESKDIKENKQESIFRYTKKHNKMKQHQRSRVNSTKKRSRS